MPFKNLTSSNIYGYDYDEGSGEMQITFVGGRTYSYSGVEKDVADGLETASSPGHYFHEKIKNKYPYQHAGGGGAQPKMGGREAPADFPDFSIIPARAPKPNEA